MGAAIEAPRIPASKGSLQPGSSSLFSRLCDGPSHRRRGAHGCCRKARTRVVVFYCLNFHIYRSIVLQLYEATTILVCDITYFH